MDMQFDKIGRLGDFGGWVLSFQRQIIYIFGLVSNMYQKNAILRLGVFVCFSIVTPSYTLMGFSDAKQPTRRQLEIFHMMQRRFQVCPQKANFVIKDITLPEMITYPSLGNHEKTRRVFQKCRKLGTGY